jgi:glycosyltransferase involved in cell wall biosynthesis
MYSVVVPVYRNESFIPALLEEFTKVRLEILNRFGVETEFVFVVDGSPDESHARLRQALPKAAFPSQLLLHSRNFGSFAATRTGLAAARGRFFGTIAADLQEPPDLLIRFLEPLLTDRCDIAVGVREGRDDPLVNRMSSGLFWRLFRWVAVPAIPVGGVDTFAGTRQVRDELLRLEESHSSLMALAYWVGFRRLEIGYHRRRRAEGKSGWTLAKRIEYMLDSLYSFTDLPVRLLAIVGALGLGVGIAFGLMIVVLRLAGSIPVTGYAATIVTIVFFGSLNMLGLGIVGAYAWRAYENTKGRPYALVRLAERFNVGSPETAAGQLSGPDTGPGGT